MRIPDSPRSSAEYTISCATGLGDLSGWWTIRDMTMTCNADRSLPDTVRDFAQKTAGHLAAAYPTGDADPDAFAEFDDIDNERDWYESERDHILDDRAITWWTTNSERTVAYLGRTFRGDFMYDDHTGVVLKFQPWLGSESDRSASDHAANANAVQVWELARDRGDTDLFATVFDYADDRSWIAMEYCTPIYTGGGSASPPYDYLDDTNGAYKREFATTFSDRGWYGNFKRGNIGLSDDDTVVLIDIGGHTDRRNA